jgi:hypothetical protein
LPGPEDSPGIGFGVRFANAPQKEETAGRRRRAQLRNYAITRRIAAEGKAAGGT